jgi:hypothetical protein
VIPAQAPVDEANPVFEEQKVDRVDQLEKAERVENDEKLIPMD